MYVCLYSLPRYMNPSGSQPHIRLEGPIPEMDKEYIRTLIFSRKINYTKVS